MLDLSRFSDLFGALGAGLLPESPPKQPGVSPPAPQPETLATPKDRLDLSAPASNLPSASFDRVNRATPVTESGTYQPTRVQMQRSTSLNFSFSASLQRATVIQRPVETPSLTRAMESTQMAYQSRAFSAARRDLGGSYSEMRQFQTDLFYSRSRSLSQRLTPETGARLENSGQQVMRRFEIEISLDFSFMQQFNMQTESLSNDEGVLTDYLDGVDGLAARSGEALQAFFGEVDQILGDTETYMQDTMGSFLADVKAAFGLSDSEADAFTAMVADEVEAFFSEVDDFLADARATLGNMLAPEADPPDIPAIESDAPEPSLVA